LVGAEVVLADGRVVDCDEERHSDLFWALRGAGGGQFGVVTALSLRTVPAPAATTFDLTWAIGDAPGLVDAWQAWAPEAPAELAASLLAVASGDPADPPTAHVFGAMLGTEADTAALIEALVAGAGVEPATVHLEHAPYRESKRWLSEHGTGESDDGPSPPHSFSKSEFFARLMPPEGVAALMEHFSHQRAPRQARTLDFSPWGGAYNRPSPQATAFVHRAHRFLLKHDVAVEAGASRRAYNEAREWLARSWELVHPWGSGGVYPNFPDPDLDDAAVAYHGPNLERLLRVKATYDPGDLFHFPQSLRGP
jgi:FAD/FMN-containing dehydrogenase